MRRGTFALITSIAIVAGALASDPAEQLANPFGGMPPEFSPDDGKDIWESWDGRLLKYRRDFTFYIDSQTGSGSAIVYATSTQFQCVTESGVTVSEAGFQVESAVGGCWEDHGEHITADTARFSDAGGYQFGEYRCTFRNAQKSVASCTYQGHRFTSKRTMKSCFENGFETDC